MPKFLTKVIPRLEAEMAEHEFKEINFLPLFEKMHSEYRMEWDGKLARYFAGLMRSKGGQEIYDVKCFDANIPPINSQKYANAEYT